MPRRIDGAWAVALAAGAAGAILFPRPISLADPPACAGLLELAGIVASRTARDVALGEMVIWANRLIVAAALICFVRVVQRVASDRFGWLAAGAAAFALLFSLPFDSVLAPTNAAPFAVACLVVLSAARLHAGRPRTFAAALSGLALLAAIAPALLWVCALLAVWLVFAQTAPGLHRLGWIAIAIAAVAIGPVLVTLAAPPLPASGVVLATALDCAKPAASLDLADAFDGLRAAFGPTTQFAMALAALGLFSVRGAGRHRAARWIAGFAALPVVAAALGAADPVRTLAPAVVVVWVLVALGLSEVVRAIAPRGARWVAATLVLASLPWLQSTAHPNRTAPGADLIRGHDALNWQRFLQVLSAIPAGGGLVVEDAIVSMLATDAGRRRAQAGRPVVLVPPERDVLARTLARTAVFALPRRQSTLRHLGFQLVDLSPRAPGVAEVRAGTPCAIVDRAWSDADALTATPGFALVVDDEPSRGPVQLLLGSAGSLAPERSWPRRAERGFAWSEVDRRGANGHVRAQALLTGLAAPAGHPIAAAPVLTSIDIWRVPGGPFILPVTFRDTPSAVLIRRREDAVPGRVWLCPSLPYDVKPFVEQ